jgi:hypothetical protein
LVLHEFLLQSAYAICNRAAKGSRWIGSVVPTQIQQFGLSRDGMLTVVS